MSELEAQQQALLAALFEWPPEGAQAQLAGRLQGQWMRGLQAYQTNGHELAHRALLAAYPVVSQLVGDASFAALSRALWHAVPPQRGDLAQWGAGLAAFMRGSEQLASEPYLPDLAALEWALHCCQSAADGTLDAASLNWLTSHAPSELDLVLAPGCTLVSSRWPVASIFGAHQQAQPSLARAGELLQAGVAETALVWRAGWRPSVRLAWPAEAAFVQAVLDGAPLQQALNAAPELDFATWLPMAAQTQLFLGVQRLNVTPVASAASPA